MKVRKLPFFLCISTNNFVVTQIEIEYFRSQPDLCSSDPFPMLAAGHHQVAEEGAFISFSGHLVLVPVLTSCNEPITIFETIQIDVC
jgi:hypothetical protein